MRPQTVKQNPRVVATIPFVEQLARRVAATMPHSIDIGDLVQDGVIGLIDAARVARTMEHNRLGVMGHYYGGMLDIYSDLTQQCAYFGGHIEMIDVEELAALRREVSDADLSRRVAEFRTSFDVQPDCSEDELLRAGKGWHDRDCGVRPGAPRPANDGLADERPVAGGQAPRAGDADSVRGHATVSPERPNYRRYHAVSTRLWR